MNALLSGMLSAILAMGIGSILFLIIVGGCGLCLMVLGLFAMSENSWLRGSTTFLAGAGLGWLAL